MPAGTTVTNFYKQNVYDPSDNKIGDRQPMLRPADEWITS
jgi:hypothetical protein